MLKTLLKLADRLDQSGLPGYANMVDRMLVSFGGQHGAISMADLMKLMPDAKQSLLNAVQFDLEAKKDSVKAVPDIDVDFYNFEVDLSKIKDSPKLHKYLTDDGKNALFPDLPTAGEHDFDYVPGKKDFSDADKSLELALKQLKREEFVDPAAQSEEGQKLYQQHQQRVKNLERARQQKEVNQYIPGALEKAEEGNFVPVEPDYSSLPPMQRLKPDPDPRLHRKTEEDIRELLVKMADDFDMSGDHELAVQVDGTLKSFSARPKAPLKQLDDDVKKNLIVFVHDADQSTSKSIKGLKELFRRLRYFDLAGSVKDTGLDKLVKDMEKTQCGLGGAKSKLYEMMMGKKPSVQALNDFVGSTDEVDDQSSLDFFDRHTEKDEEEEPQEEGIEDIDEEEEELTDELEAELESFLASLDEDEDDDEDDEEVEGE